MKSYTLYLSARSPFARRIRLLLINQSVPHHIDAMNVFDYNEKLFQSNPLGLVPTLLTPEGQVITDSTNILEYFHEKLGTVWPKDFGERTAARQASIWAAGIMQFVVSYFLETSHHVTPDPSWAKEYEENIVKTLTLLNSLPPTTWVKDSKVTQAGYDIAVAIQYLQMRLPHLSTDNFSALMNVVSRCMQEPSFVETMPPK